MNSPFKVNENEEDEDIEKVTQMHVLSPDSALSPSSRNPRFKDLTEPLTLPTAYIINIRRFDNGFGIQLVPAATGIFVVKVLEHFLPII